MSILLALLLQGAFHHQSSLLLGGDFRAAAVDDSLLYVAEGRGISVFTQDRFEYRGGAMLAGKSHEVIRSGEYLFVATTRGLVRILLGEAVNGDPGQTWLHHKGITALAYTEQGVWFADSQYLYLIDPVSGESLLEENHILPAPVTRIIPHEDRLYLAADTDGLYVLEPGTDEPEIRKVPLKGDLPVLDLYINGKYAYLACAEAGLGVAQVKKNSFKIIDVRQVRGEAYRVEVFGKRLALAAGTGHILVYSLSEPASPVELQQESFPGASTNLVKAGDMCFVLNGVGFSKLDFSSPTLVGRGLMYRGLGSGYKVLTSGNIGVLAGGKSGVRVFSVAHDSLSFISAYLDIPDTRKVYLFGNLVYALTSTNQLKVIDIKDPYNPTRRTFIHFDTRAGGIDAWGEMMLAAESDNGVGVWWRCPCGPLKEKRRWSSGARALDVQIDGKVGYVSTADPAALYVLDWPDTVSMDALAELKLDRSYEHLFLADENLYALDEDGTFTVFNVARPLSPKKIGSVELAGTPVELAPYGDTMFVAAPPAGIHVIDISDLKTPLLLSTFELDEPRGVAVTGDRLIVSTPYSVEAYRIQ